MKFKEVSVLVFLGIIGSVLTVSLRCETSQQKIHLHGDHRNAHLTCVISNVHLTNFSEEVTLPDFTRGDTNIVGVQFRNSVVKFFPKELLKAFPRLQVIDLEGQHVDAVYRDNFVGGASFIKTYWAQDNEITELGPNAFSYMGKMYTLYLENNPIEYIHALAFSGLPKLKILFLKGTNMKTLSFESFWYLYDLNLVNFKDFKGKSNCMNQEFDSLGGDLSSVEYSIRQNCPPGDPFKTEITKSGTADCKAQIQTLQKDNRQCYVDKKRLILESQNMVDDVEKHHQTSEE